MAILWPNGLTTPPPFSVQGHFGPRNADLPYASSWHRGQDFYGFEWWHAIADGTVVHVGTRAGWFGGGVMVVVQHDGFFSRSLHMAEGSPVVRVGQRVKAGDRLGRLGNTPRRVPPMAVHAHLEITLGTVHWANVGQIDPRAFLEERVGGTATGAGGTAAPNEEEDDMFTDDDRKLLQQVRDQLGGASGRKTSAREDIDEIGRQTKATAQILGSTVKRAKDGDTIGIRLDKIIAHLGGRKKLGLKD